MYVEHWRKLAWETFLGNFPILLVQTIQYATVFAIKNKLRPVILTSNFDLVPPFYFLK